MQLTKRDFLKTVGTVSATAGLGAVLPVRLSAAAPIQRNGKPRLNLSLAAYSFRDYFKIATHGQNRPADAKSIDMHDFIDGWSLLVPFGAISFDLVFTLFLS